MKKSKAKTPKKTKWKVMTYEFPIKGKLAKQVREQQERDEVQRKIDRTCIRDLALYFEGLKQGKGDILPFGDIHIKTLWNVLKKI